MDWCAPTPNCLREGGKSLPKRGGKGEGVTQKIRRWEGERETDNGIGKESGVLDVITRKKRQHSGTFTLKTNIKNKMYNGNDNESVKKLVEQWECSGKESGTREQGQRVYCFGKNHESELMVGSPLKRRRIVLPHLLGPLLALGHGLLVHLLQGEHARHLHQAQGLHGGDHHPPLLLKGERHHQLC